MSLSRGVIGRVGGLILLVLLIVSMAPNHVLAEINQGDNEVDTSFYTGSFDKPLYYMEGPAPLDCQVYAAADLQVWPGTVPQPIIRDGRFTGEFEHVVKTINFNYRFDWGDGTSTDKKVQWRSDSSGNTYVIVPHRYTKTGTFKIYVTLSCDWDGLPSSRSDPPLTAKVTGGPGVDVGTQGERPEPKTKERELVRREEPQAVQQGPLASAIATEGVDVGSGQLKPGWVLYGQTDMSDERAKKIYEEKVKQRIAVLEAASKECAKRLAAAKRHSMNFEEAVKAQNPSLLVSSLQSDMDKAKGQRARALGALFGSAAGFATAPDPSKIPYPLLAERLEKLRAGATTALDIKGATESVADLAAFITILKDKRGDLSQEDWETGGNGLAGCVSSVGGLVGSSVGTPIAVAQVILGGTEWMLAHRLVGALEKSIQQTTVPLEENRARLRYQIQKEQLTCENLDRQLAILKEEGRYLKSWE